MFKRFIEWLLPAIQLHKGRLIVRLYEHPWNLDEERIAFTGIGESKFRFIGEEIQVEEVHLEIPHARGEPSTLPRITSFTLALEDFPDMEAMPPLCKDIEELTRPMTLHLYGRNDEPLLIISRD